MIANKVYEQQTATNMAGRVVNASLNRAISRRLTARAVMMKNKIIAASEATKHKMESAMGMTPNDQS
jgi:hypothetical protein